MVTNLAVIRSCSAQQDVESVVITLTQTGFRLTALALNQLGRYAVGFETHTALVQKPGDLPVPVGCNPFVDGSRARNFKARYARYGEIELAIGLDKVSLLSELSTQIRRDDDRIFAVLDVRTGQAVGPIGLLLGFAPHLHPKNGICATGWV